MTIKKGSLEQIQNIQYELPYKQWLKKIPRERFVIEIITQLLGRILAWKDVHALAKSLNGTIGRYDSLFQDPERGKQRKNKRVQCGSIRLYQLN